MFNEAKILFENIKHLRYLLTEGVSDRDIVDAINEHEYLYIYYKGEGTISTGYRTIRPFVLGVNTSGNLALRAWQDKGKSDSNSPSSTKNRLGHEHHHDTDGSTVSGWRLFLVDNITEILPIGEKFVDEKGIVMIPPGYNEHDKDMTGGIVASVSAHPEQEVQKDISGVTPTVAKKVPKWQKYENANKNNRRITPKDLGSLWNLITRVYKGKRSDYFVTIDNRNQFDLVYNNVKPKFQAKYPNAIVGDFTELYDKYVVDSPANRAKKDNFYKQEINKVARDTANSVNKEQTNPPMFRENENIPIVRKTFFKP